MTDPLPTPEQTREILAEFTTRGDFEQAVAGLLGAGFERTDLSVLASHDSLEIAGGIGGYGSSAEGHDPVSLHRGLGAVLEEQLPWLAPIATAGVLLAAAGPVGAAFAAVLGGAAGAVALRPAFDEVMGDIHADRFSQAVADGHILLWVRTASADRVAAAEALLGGATETTRMTKVTLETL